MLDAAGVRTMSSQALAEQFHLNAAQIRKDLAYFGEFGVRGVGYYVKELRRHLRQILGIDKSVRVAIMGAGNLGLALADYPGFRDEGFEIVALFDTLQREDRTAVAQRRRHLRHPRFPSVVRRERVTIAVIAVPADAAQAVVNTVVAAGVKAILNFSPGTLQVPPDVKLKSVDLTVSLGEPVVLPRAGRAGVTRRKPEEDRPRPVVARGRREAACGWSTSARSRRPRAKRSPAGASRCPARRCARSARAP